MKKLQGLSRCPRFHWHRATYHGIIRRHGPEIRLPVRIPASVWDITGQQNPRKQAAPARRKSRRRKTASGMRQDGAKPVDVDKA